MLQALRPIWTIVFFAAAVALLQAQDLAPRAYTITPLHSNAVILTYGYNDGTLFFNNAVPVTDATGTYHASVFSYYHSFGLLGHSSNISASIPYAIGTFEGKTIGVDQQIYRSGLLDTTFRWSVNLKGGPAMQVSDFLKWTEKSLLGVSLKVAAPAGQYDPNNLINWGTNRWSFKPELGYSRRRRNIVLDAYGGVWVFTRNEQAYTPLRPQPQTLNPIVAFETHVSYDVKPLLWFSLDGNFWHGGLATLRGVENPDTLQTSSRIGATASVPLVRHQTVKFSYSHDVYLSFGGNYQNISVAWQYSWLGRPQ